MALDIQPIKPRAAFLLATLFASFWMVMGYPVLPHSKTIDFLNLYTGAFFALHWDWHHIYTTSGQIAQEQLLVPGHKGLWPFVRTPAYAILMSPLALMPFGVAFGFWIFSQISLFVGCMGWAWKRFGPVSIVLGTVYFATPVGISLGQDCALYLTIVCASFALGDRKKFFLSGLILGLGLTKFHLFLLWPLVLLFARRWRMLAGFTVSGIVQGLVALAVLGWTGLTGLQGETGYAGFILHLNTYYAPKMNIDLNAILLNTGLPAHPWLVVSTGLVAVLILWSSRPKDALGMTFALAISGSLLVAPHAYSYDGAMLLLPAWWVMSVSGFRFSKIAAVTLCSPLPLIASFSGRPIEFFVALALVLFVICLTLENRLELLPEKDEGLPNPAAQI